jgi:hypothetical protein
MYSGVPRLSEAEPGLGEPLAAGFAHGPRDPEVGDQGVAVREQDVLRLDVPVHDALLVRVAEAICDFSRELQRVFDRELLLPVQSVTQRFAVDERHDVEEGLDGSLDRGIGG